MRKASAMSSFEEMPLRDIVNSLRDGEIVPFLGAGASQAGLDSKVRLPAGRGLADELSARLGSPQDLTAGPLAKVAQYYEFRTDRTTLYRFMRSRFYEDQQGTEIGSTSRLIAENLGIDGSKPPIIVTTNYDNQIERALEEVGRAYVVVTHEFGKGNAKLLTSSDGKLKLARDKDFLLGDYSAGTVFVYKMHGTLDWPVDEARNTVIITEDDYVAFILNSRPACIPPSALVREFSVRRFLFLGYSLEDWNFRVILRLISQVAESKTRALGPMRHVAVDLGATTVDEELWGRRGVHLYAADLVVFVGAVRRILSSEKSR
jgi:hypothetical protein